MFGGPFRQASARGDEHLGPDLSPSLVRSPGPSSTARRARSVRGLALLPTSSNDEDMRFTPAALKWGMRIWPPYLGAGVVVRDIAEDWSSARIELRRSRFNANALGTAFGGSIQSMTDPFHTLLLMHQLGRDHIVWDSAAEIRFVSPGRSRLFATIEMPAEAVEKIRRETADGQKSLTWFETEITDAEGKLVAQVRRQVYARRKRDLTPAAPDRTQTARRRNGRGLAPQPLSLSAGPPEFRPSPAIRQPGSRRCNRRSSPARRARSRPPRTARGAGRSSPAP